MYVLFIWCSFNIFEVLSSMLNNWYSKSTDILSYFSKIWWLFRNLKKDPIFLWTKLLILSEDSNWFYTIPLMASKWSLNATFVLLKNAWIWGIMNSIINALFISDSKWRARLRKSFILAIVLKVTFWHHVCC